MRIQDQALLALTMWRENRGGGVDGMRSIANVIMNRVAKHGSNAYVECTKPLQFSSLTAKGDAELTLWPKDSDAQWQQALDLAAQAAGGSLADITGGATLYYAPAGLTPDETKFGKLMVIDGQSVKFPDTWNAGAVDYTVTVARQVFFREQ